MSSKRDRQKVFFDFLFDGTAGYLNLAVLPAGTRSWKDSYFAYPENLDLALNFIDEHTPLGNIYFCPTLLDEEDRHKDSISEARCLWADLDECPPTSLRLEPTLVIQTSPGRHQAFWKLVAPVKAEEVERYNRRIAYAHADEGCDKTGWDLTQMLRVPLTGNFKYGKDLTVPQIRTVAASATAIYSLSDFEHAYPAEEAEVLYDAALEPMPEVLPNPEAALSKYSAYLNPRVHQLVETVPTGSWSEPLWELELSLFESGMAADEVMAVAAIAACNKYARDDRDANQLWKEVLRAQERYRDKARPVVSLELPEFRLEPLLSEGERRWCEEHPSIIEEYIEWAVTVGDAARQYHQVGAFVILSTLLAGSIRLPTSFGTIVPNCWFMILADTTLTRKTTAMDMAMDVVNEVEPDCLLATDGSIEGLMTQLSFRPGKPSVFLRDEFSGLIEMMTKRDYYAGMAETFTKLYDGKTQKRVLRRETITVKDPVLIMFVGGIKDKIMQLLTEEHVSSGFIPRFVVVAAESDVTRIKPLGPPSDRSTGARDTVVAAFRDIYGHYQGSQQVTVGGTTIEAARRWEAQLTPEAWSLYNRYEANMLESAMRSHKRSIMTPAFDRLSKTGLKIAVMLAAAECPGTVVAGRDHIVRAFYYIEQWRIYTVEVLESIGFDKEEVVLNRILKDIRTRSGISRSRLMQTHRLSARQADNIFVTLEQRGLIKRQRASGTEHIFILE